MTIDEVITEVSKEWATGKWTSIVIAIAEAGNSSLGYVGGANQSDNGLENGKCRRSLKKIIRQGFTPVGIITTGGGKQHLLPLAGSGFSVGKDPETGQPVFERRVYPTDA
jgi:hypothetical protein